MNAPSERRAIARNAVSSYGQRALLALSVLLVTPYLFRSLGAAGFGTWSVMLTVASVFSLLEVGFSASVTKFVAELRGLGRTEELGRTIRFGVILMAGLGLVALAVSLAVALFAAGLAAPGTRHDFRVGLIVLGLAMLIRFPCVAFGSALIGWQRYDLFSAAEAVTILGFAVGAVIAIETGSGVLGLAIAQAAALLSGAALFALLLRRTAPGVGLRPSVRDARGQRHLAQFGSYTLMADSMAFVAERMDTVVIAAIRGAAVAGPYAAAVKLRSGLQSLTLPLFNLLPSMVSELRARGENAEVVRRFVLASRVAVQVSLPAAAVLGLFAPDVIHAWLGRGASSSTAHVVVVLMVVESLALAATPAHHVLIGAGRARLIGGFGVIDGVSNLALSIALVSAWGAIGAAWGTLLTSSLFGLLKIPLAARTVGCPGRELVGRGLVPALAASIPALAAMAAVRVLMSQGTGRVALGAVLGLGLAAAIAVHQIGPGRIAAAIRSLARGAVPRADDLDARTLAQTAE